MMPLVYNFIRTYSSSLQVSVLVVREEFAAASLIRRSLRRIWDHLLKRDYYPITLWVGLAVNIDLAIYHRPEVR